MCACVCARKREGDLYEHGEIAAGEIIRTSYGSASIKAKREQKRKREQERRVSK